MLVVMVGFSDPTRFLVIHVNECCAVCPLFDRDLCRQYQKKYREKVHSVSVSSSLKQELEVRGWEGRVVMGGEGFYGRGGWLWKGRMVMGGEDGYGRGGWLWEGRVVMGGEGGYGRGG